MYGEYGGVFPGYGVGNDEYKSGAIQSQGYGFQIPEASLHVNPAMFGRGSEGRGGRGMGLGRGGHGGPPAGEGDWKCEACENINFARRTKCNKCDTPKIKAMGASFGAVGEEFAKKSGGLFAENDWKCFLCGNINWAKRKVCNECQAPRPGADKEDRKGRWF